MTIETIEDNSKTKSLLLLGSLSAAYFVLYIVTNGNYGIFRGEFYYLACADHLAWGYVDHPPLSIALLALSKAVLGDSIHAIRLLPALTAAITVMVVGLITRELGGKLFAQALAAISAMIAPYFLVLFSFFSMNSFDLLFWALSFIIVIRIIKTENRKLWLVFGLVVGLGLLNKISLLYFGFSLVVAMLLTPHRRYLMDKYFWAGGAIALLLFLPHILWQVANDWPTFEFMANAKRYKIAAQGPVQFFLDQILSMHPLTFPVWMLGIVSFIFAKSMRPYRVLGYFYLIALAFLMLQKSKGYYLAPAYSVVLAGGACGIEAFIQDHPLRLAKPVLLTILLMGGIALAPMALPLLPVEKFVAYQKAIGLMPQTGENNPSGELPQYFADRFGWENMAKVVAFIYKGLSPEVQTECAIVTGNYGEAGALDYYRNKYGLPPAFSQHNNYFLWGPGNISGRTIICLGISPADLQESFAEVTAAAVIVSPYAMPYETNLTVYICRNLKKPVKQAWQEGKHFI